MVYIFTIQPGAVAEKSNYSIDSNRTCGPTMPAEIHTYKLYLITLAPSAIFAGFHEGREKTEHIYKLEMSYISKRKTKREYK